MNPRAIAYIQSFRRDTMSPGPHTTRHLFGVLDSEGRLALAHHGHNAAGTRPGIGYYRVQDPTFYTDYLSGSHSVTNFIIVTFEGKIEDYVPPTDVFDYGFKFAAGANCEVITSSYIDGHMRKLPDEVKIRYTSVADARAALRVISHMYRILMRADSRVKVTPGLCFFPTAADRPHVSAADSYISF